MLQNFLAELELLDTDESFSGQDQVVIIFEEQGVFIEQKVNFFVVGVQKEGFPQQVEHYGVVFGEGLQFVGVEDCVAGHVVDEVGHGDGEHALQHESLGEHLFEAPELRHPTAYLLLLLHVPCSTSPTCALAVQEVEGILVRVVFHQCSLIFEKLFRTQMYEGTGLRFGFLICMWVYWISYLILSIICLF